MRTNEQFNGRLAVMNVNAKELNRELSAVSPRQQSKRLLEGDPCSGLPSMLRSKLGICRSRGENLLQPFAARGCYLRQRLVFLSRSRGEIAVRLHCISTSPTRFGRTASAWGPSWWWRKGSSRHIAETIFAPGAWLGAWIAYPLRGVTVVLVPPMWGRRRFLSTSNCRPACYLPQAWMGTGAGGGARKNSATCQVSAPSSGRTSR